MSGGPETVTGPEAIVKAVSTTLEALPDLRVTVTNAFADGAHGFAEVVREGTNTGPIRLPGLSRPPTGRSVRLPDCIVFEVRDGKVVRMAPYSVRFDAMSQLGLLTGDGGFSAARTE